MTNVLRTAGLAASVAALVLALEGQVTSPRGDMIAQPGDTQRIAVLEKQVADLSAAVAVLKTHTHSYAYASQSWNGSMSFAQLRDALQPHSTTDINAYYISFTLGPAKREMVQTTTSAPVKAAP